MRDAPRRRANTFIVFAPSEPSSSFLGRAWPRDNETPRTWFTPSIQAPSTSGCSRSRSRRCRVALDERVPRRAASRCGAIRPARRSGSTATSASRRTSRPTRRTSRRRSRGSRGAAVEAGTGRTAASTRRRLLPPRSRRGLRRGRDVASADAQARRVPEGASPTTPTPSTRSSTTPAFVATFGAIGGETAEARPAGLPGGPSRGRPAQAQGPDLRPSPVRRRRHLARPARRHRRLVRGRGAGHALARLRCRRPRSLPTRNPSRARARRYNRRDTPALTAACPDAGRHPGRIRPMTQTAQTATDVPPRRQALHLRVGRRPRRGRRDDARPARRQGRGPRRDDQRGPARAARLHDHDRGLQRLLRRRREAPGRAVGRRPRGRQARSSRRPARASATPPTRSSCRVRSGAKFSMPGHDGHRPQPGPQRGDAPRPGRADRQRALRLGRLPPLHPDVRPHRHGREGRAVRPRPRRGQARAAASRRTPT